ncbi:MAG TPA: polyprenyl synthetase family protein [Acidobacteriota bacterium]|nr:polyprenyl synthetase family protein [Acidobacteriota bacterium]
MAIGSVLTTKDIFRLIEHELAEVEATLRAYSDNGVPLVGDINQYVHESGGKRLRPALLLLAARSCGYQGPSAIRLAAVVELIHVATLVHDDIIDNASLRRGRPSVNNVWGNSITVLMGDWLYMTSFRLALDLKDFRILELLIDVTRTMVEGELMQLDQMGCPDISVTEQLEICRRKTACLFGACGRLSGVLAKVGPKLEQKIERYGNSLGMAFQLIDDLLDYTSNESVLGKPVLKDLEEGRVTLPITYLMQRATPKEREFVAKVIRNREFTPENKARILDLVHTYETGNELKQLAESYAEDAKESLADFPDSIYRDALLRIPEFVTSRES